MKLKVYVDRMSQPSRAILIFCKVNGIDFEEIKIDLQKRQQFSPEFKEVNVMGKVPAIVDGKFKLFERYPNDLFKRAKIHSVLDWHHSNLRFSSAKFVLNTILGTALGIPMNPQTAAKAEKLLSASLQTIRVLLAQGQWTVFAG